MRSTVRGFTLLEVLVAIGIMALVFVLAQQVLSGSIARHEHQQAYREALESSQRTLVFMTLDMEQLVPRPVRDSFGDVRPAVEGAEQALSVTRLGWANPFSLRQRSSLQRVHWFLRDGELIRSYMPALDSGVGVEAEEVVMLEDVARLEFRYLERNANGEYNWLTEWPPLTTGNQASVTQPMPASIEVTLEMQNGQSLHRYFRLVHNPWS
jgi:general secretion pathway protein J